MGDACAFCGSTALPQNPQPLPIPFLLGARTHVRALGGLMPGGGRSSTRPQPGRRPADLDPVKSGQRSAAGRLSSKRPRR
jgi:hypothetical protein